VSKIGRITDEEINTATRLVFEAGEQKVVKRAA
jgi:hypothetical protein